MSTNGNGNGNGARPQRAAAASRTRSASPSSASATAPTPSSRASSTTGTPTRRRTSRASCTSTSAATTSATSSSRPRSTSTPRRSARISATRSGRARTTRSSSPRCRKIGVPVHRGMTHDGLGKYLKQKITKAPGETADIVADPQGHEDRRRRLLPAGRVRGRDEVVRRADPRGRLRLRQLHPRLHRPRDYWNKRFKKAGLPIVGDDIKSQVGATIVHRSLARLFHDRGVRMQHTSQLNVGGNMDFFNMLERERLESKKISKTNAVTSIMGHELPADDVHVGPSDYVPWLTDRKWAHIRARGPGVRRRAAEPWSSSSRCGTRPTRPASSSTRCAAASSPSTTASAASSTARAPTS